jgi:alkanesulfonate monooxygenase SsuD/methylene tetrahydromethanopterin reductase-like flavin-dependent oxidoreductase (luciferase family)
MEEGIEIIKKAWETDGKWSHKGRFYEIPEMAITPKPLQKQIPFYMACFSKASMEIAGRMGLGIVFAPFAAAMTFGDLKTAVQAYRDECAKHGNKPGKAMCSYFIWIGEGEEENYARERQIAYFRRAVKPAIMQDPSQSPPSMLYMNKIVEILDGVHKEDLGEQSILLGSTHQILDSLKRIEAAGIEEVILYFNVGGKPHVRVMAQMAQFMSEVAPHFHGSHKTLVESTV